MDEYFKTIRFIHRLLITLSLVVLTFAFSPDPAAPYKEARNDLEKLLSISLEEYAEFVIEGLELEEEASFKTVGSLIPVDSTQLDDFKLCFENTDVELLRNTFFFIVPDKTYSPIADYLDFLGNSWMVELGISDEGMYDIILNYELNCDSLINKALYKLGISVVSPKFEPVRSYEDPFKLLGMDELKELGYNEYGPKLDWVKFSEFLVSKPEIALIAGWTRTVEDASIVYSLRSSEEFFSPSMAPTDAVYWYSQDSTIETYDKALPGIYLIEDEIKSKTLEDGLRYVNKQIAQNENHPTLYGIKIHKAIANWIVPSISLAVFLYFLSHIQGFRSYLDQGEVFVDFPTVILFKGIVPGLIALFSVVVLPVLANFCLLQRVSGTGTLGGIIGYILTLSVATCSVYAYLELRKLTESLQTKRVEAITTLTANADAKTQTTAEN